MKNKSIDDYEYVLKVLEESYYSGESPAVTLIANTKKTPYHILVSTLLSLRTKDEVTLKSSKRIFSKADDIYKLNGLSEQEIVDLIYPVGFYKTKAKRLKEIAHIIIDKYSGNIPDDFDKLLELPGVGRKTANLVVILGFNKNSICVDTHVHRISNRMGWVKTNTPDETEFALKKCVPQELWTLINEYFVSYGQIMCKPVSPLCSKCPLDIMCPKAGVLVRR